jgi:catechol 2,3-dioxygenase-like lactoylglutathione lyase family enzyme
LVYAVLRPAPGQSRWGRGALGDRRARLALHRAERGARGRGPITLAVVGLDALLERLAAQGIEYEPIETYSNGVRHVNVPDPDGNVIAFAEPPEAASASPRSVGTGLHDR